jgi:hypothetical protein
MNQHSGLSRGAAAILGIFIMLGLLALGYLLADGAIRYKEYERTVVVKGLSEKEYPADTVIWPIQFSVASNQLEQLYGDIQARTGKIQSFLLRTGILASEITLSAPAITDKSAQQYGGGQRAPFRYTAVQTVTVYSVKVDQVRQLMNQISVLGKEGIVFIGNNYDALPEYLFGRLNEIKPVMIEEATTNARAVAAKFAEDSNSRLGKIKSARQGQFSISERDRNNPHIKKIRVVSTVEYYLSD